MRRRRIRWILLVLAGLAVLAWLAPEAYWRLEGWRRGEPLYRNRPVSYWAEDLRHWQMSELFRGGPDGWFHASGEEGEVAIEDSSRKNPNLCEVRFVTRDGRTLHHVPRSLATGWTYRRDPRWLQQLRVRFPRLGLLHQAVLKIQREPPLSDWDADSVPVLRALLSVDNASIRWRAAYRLRALGEAAGPAVPELTVRQFDPDPDVRETAYQALRKLRPEAAARPEGHNPQEAP